MTNDITLPHAEAPSPFDTLWHKPTSNRGHLSIGGDGSLRFLGIEHGKATAIGLVRVPGLGLVLTVHEAGSKYWSGRGMQSYAGARILTLLIERSGADRFRYVRLTDVEVPNNDAKRVEASVGIVQRLLAE